MIPARPLDEIARLPSAGDNAAIATAPLPAGCRVIGAHGEIVLEHGILEGHRFAVRPIAAGEALLSWGMPFGYATRPIAPGGYLCNRRTLEALRERDIDFGLPDRENFRDHSEPFDLAAFPLAPAPPPPPAESLHFEGYLRSPARGVGTRNAVVLLGTSSRAAGFVRALEARLAESAERSGIDGGIVAVAHTEGGSAVRPNNAELLLRTLAGFVVHPNVGAVLIVDEGGEAIGNEALQQFLRSEGYPLDEVPHAFMRLGGDLERDLRRGEERVRGWLEPVAECQRSLVSAAQLKIALQCGGSDAFSGVSGNPLAAWVAARVIRSGGAANLAETDELIGAEGYLLQRVRDEETARRFVATVDRFRRWSAWHGVSPEGNPSGGNRFRGLYNIALKSLGAAMKRDPEVVLERVIDYAAPLPGPGLTFMDSPGNDLESVAGQVASGANLIFFVTGNGSITNFPFVPTLKFVTTSARYRMLPAEMDVNAGAYLDGEPLERVGRRALQLTLETASGRRSAGERAGHAQVQIWRDWPQTEAAPPLESGGERSGEALPVLPEPAVEPEAKTTGTRPLRRSARGGGIALVLPTSLCAGRIGLRAAERLNRRIAAGLPFSRAVSLFHTEGCGAAGGDSEQLYLRTLFGYAAHPLVSACLFLEHGCEKTHNDFMRARLREANFDPEAFGWASIQHDGGIDGVLGVIEHWFERLPAGDGPPSAAAGAILPLSLGLLAETGIPAELAPTLAELIRRLLAAGGTVVVPESVLQASPALVERLLDAAAIPTLAYGQRALAAGFQVMETPTAHPIEILSGLGATGVETVLAFVADKPLPAHPLVPVLQVSVGRGSGDLDEVLTGDPGGWSERLLTRIAATAAGSYLPTLLERGYTDFQITRGRLGISV